MEVEMEEEETQTTSSKEKWIEEMDNMHIESAIMNRLVLDYLVMEGFKEAAEKFEEEAGITSRMSMEGLEEKIKIRDAILEGSVSRAISLINDLLPELLDNNRVLLFHLQLQQLIELIRNKRIEDAIEFAQIQLSERGEDNPECLGELERALSLMVFEQPEQSPFADLLLQPQRHKVWGAVNTAIMEHQNELQCPKLTNIINLLMWSQEQLDSKKIAYPKMTIDEICQDSSLDLHLG